ncbi:hypothetical protein V8C35DRAFT_294011 [Trichoderma chlorosporum]
MTPSIRTSAQMLVFLANWSILLTFAFIIARSHSHNDCSKALQPQLLSIKGDSLGFYASRHECEGSASKGQYPSFFFLPSVPLNHASMDVNGGY